MSIEQQVGIRCYDGQSGEKLVRVDNIPGALLNCTQWVCWRYVGRGEGKKPEKQSLNPRTMHRTGVHWPNTWTDFGTAYETYLAFRVRGTQGAGFVLTPDDSYIPYQAHLPILLPA